jgi:hypothetical protein
VLPGETFGLVAAANRVKIISDQQIDQKEGLRIGGFTLLSLLNLNRAFKGLPVACDSIDDLMGALSAGAGFV